MLSYNARYPGSRLAVDLLDIFLHGSTSFALTDLETTYAWANCAS